MVSDSSLNSEWRFSYRVLLPILVAGALAALLVGGMLLYAASETDAVSREREQEIASHVLAAQFSKVTHDQQSSTTWDESVRRVQEEPIDLEWFDLNLGVWLHEYFGHDRAYVLNARDEPIYAMVDGARAAPSSYVGVSASLQPLVRRLREAVRAGEFAASAETPYVRNIVVIDARPAIASAVQIISDTGRLQQPPGTEGVHISIRFLDGSLLQDLSRQYLLKDTRFAWNESPAGDEAALPLARASGTILGYFIWKPNSPGWNLLTRAGPVLFGALLLIAAIIAFLVRRLKRSATELQASEAQAQHLAFHDTLTGLPNRALFNDRLDRALVEARRTGSGLALLYLDLDRFKNINDTLGHPAGDDLIRELAHRLTALAGERDCVARLGGDEFAVIRGGAALNDVEALCERIIESVAQPFQLLGNAAFVGVSIGVAMTSAAALDRPELVRKADIALYCAKSTGRNRFCVFAEEMDRSIQRRREIERELRAAMAAGDEFFVEYQPLYAGNGASIVCLEALLRWRHPEHGVIPPGVFIPIAEESGLIQAIGEWVLREACKAGRRWPSVRRIAVNVSAVQFRSPGFAEHVLEILAETGMQPSRLEVEITESVLLDSAELSAGTFNRLRAAGVRIALDDFGTGYSSLSYLQNFAIDKIKIDRSFVQNLDTASASDAIVQAMVSLARAMGVDVTAEGVETAQQRNYLQSIGCDELQGFLLSRPLGEEQVDSLIGLHAGSALQRPIASAA